MILVHVGHVLYRPESGTPYHLSRALSKYFPVVYINPMVGLWDWYRWYNALRTTDAFGSHVKVITPIAPGGLRFIPRPYRHTLTTILTTIQMWSLFQDLRKQKVILWVSNSGLAIKLHSLLRPTVTCYHRLDDFGAMDPRLTDLELALEQIADIIFVVSPHLIPQHQARGREAVLLPNAVSADIFAKALEPRTPVPTDLLAIPQPRVGFIGAITPEWIDIELVLVTAQKNPQWHFVLIGPRWPRRKWKHLHFPKNVHFLGMRPYHLLPNYLKGIDVCLLPFKQNAITFGASPLKLYEYLAAGRAVVSTYVPDVNYFENLAWVANDASDFSKAIHQALKTAHDPAAQQARLRAVQPHTWDSRAQKVYHHVSQFLRGEI
ncbi:MAG: hypothetical protein C4337_09250 [Armatimonadota bacterium]